jgi:hypothetical protein
MFETDMKTSMLMKEQRYAASTSKAVETNGFQCCTAMTPFMQVSFIV